MMRKVTNLHLLGCLLVAAFMVMPTQSWALNILLCNDDGFESASTYALAQSLEQAGHKVVISAPFANRSSTGGSVPVLEPIEPVTSASPFGTIKAGAPGVGEVPDQPDVHYVNSSPVGACMYGLDVVAYQTWGSQPDLVISGPNYGSNIGLGTTLISGTINAALFALNRGIPAIAVSYDGGHRRSFSQLSSGAVEYRIANLVVQLVEALQAAYGKHEQLLPSGVALNVNIPELKPEQPLPAFRFAEFGPGQYELVFYEHLSNSPVAKRALDHGLDLPGISAVVPGIQPPTGVVLPDKQISPATAAAIVGSGQIAVSVMEGGASARRSNEDAVRVLLDSLFGGQ